ncbi:hypothetical protein EV702DRAFT_1049062 [Suillus placidus]|uniref:Uncharacterized protein n=1 Tax=Suillus placidus TaxID=48579 RepID=A0A9P6ZME2_9AGAM|nr:hypothetical protein EV702DRAFT_1049062 [Suillus placidus]
MGNTFCFVQVGLIAAVPTDQGTNHDLLGTRSQHGNRSDTHSVVSFEDRINNTQRYWPPLSRITWRFMPCIVAWRSDILFNRYDFPLDDLRLGGRRIVAEQGILHDLVRVVRSKLNAEDAALLSDNALEMIFGGRKNTVHQEGNDAASKEILNLAVPETGLDPSQLKLLQTIYEFTHNEVPQV